MEMMNDLEKNKKEIDSYKLSTSKGMPNGIKFNIQVISQSAWEINKKSMEKMELPKFLTTCMDDFQNFYLKKHSGQKLMWCLGLSKLDIQYLYLKNKNISISTLPQFLTLLQLETHGTLTIQQIANSLGCQVSTVITDLHGLVFNPSYNPQGQPEKGVIVGSFNAKAKEFKENDTISINKNFTVARQKFNTMPLAVKKTASEVRETELEEAQITKRYQDNILQATLTRIMKSKIGQTTTHVWLINEAAKQIDLFKAQPQQIKENIEKLIEKNIIKRSEKNRTCYDYIA
jgi:DNA-binding MarR family transcriptional regulator